MRRWMLLAAATLLAAGACAQFSGLSVRGGFYKGSTFDGATPGSDLWLEGFQVGLDVPLKRLPLNLAEIRFSPTYVLGGSNRKGGDTDGNLWRLMLTARVGVPGQPVYVLGGLGYAGTQTRGGAKFDPVEGFVGQVGLGYTLHRGLLTSTFIEASGFIGKGQLAGIGVDLGVRF